MTPLEDVPSERWTVQRHWRSHEPDLLMGWPEPKQHYQQETPRKERKDQEYRRTRLNPFHFLESLHL